MTREEAREALSVLKIYDAQWLREAVDMAIEALSADAEWIPCSERLPSEPFGCLVTVEDSYFDGSGWSECVNVLPYFVGYDGTTWNDADGEECPFEVIAWMPLPTPYKGGDDK